MSRMRKPIARVPDGVRIYAIGDVHGRADLLEQTISRIEADIANYPADRAVLVLLGDYVDRGPHSRQVLDLLIDRARHLPMVCLKGNHETFVTAFIDDPSVLATWKQYGGLNTLMSYGLTPTINAGEHEWTELARAFREALPDNHRRFLASLQPSFTCGD